MKYGERLANESAPQWQIHNMDYNYLKHLIKASTADDKVTRVVIPGCVDEEARIFEDQFLAELCESYRGVGLFVTSKVGEVDRRLGAASPPTTQARVRQLYEQQSGCSHDLASLERFIDAQLIGFQKLLKKYRKWTCSTTLDTRFRSAISTRPGNLTKQSIGPLLLLCDSILEKLKRELPLPNRRLAYHPGASTPGTPATLSRVITPSRPTSLLLPGASGYWNEYSDASGLEHSDQIDAFSLAGPSLATFLSLAMKGKGIDHGRTLGGSSTASESDGRFTSFRRFSFSPYGTAHASSSASLANAELSCSTESDSQPGSCDDAVRPEENAGQVGTPRRSDAADERADIVPISAATPETDEVMVLWTTWCSVAFSLVAAAFVAPFVIGGGPVESSRGVAAVACGPDFERGGSAKSVGGSQRATAVTNADCRPVYAGAARSSGLDSNDMHGYIAPDHDVGHGNLPSETEWPAATGSFGVRPAESPGCWNCAGGSWEQAFPSFSALDPMAHPLIGGGYSYSSASDMSTNHSIEGISEDGFHDLLAPPKTPIVTRNRSLPLALVDVPFQDTGASYERHDAAFSMMHMQMADESETDQPVARLRKSSGRRRSSVSTPAAGVPPACGGSSAPNESAETLMPDELRARIKHNRVEKRYRNRLSAQFERLLAVLVNARSDGGDGDARYGSTLGDEESGLLSLSDTASVTPVTPAWMPGNSPVPDMRAASLSDVSFATDDYAFAQHLCYYPDGASGGTSELTTYNDHASYTMSEAATPTPHSHQLYPCPPAYPDTYTSPASVPSNQIQGAYPDDTPMSASANAFSTETHDTADATDTDQCGPDTHHTDAYFHRQGHRPSISTPSDGNTSGPEDTGSPGLRQRRIRNKHVEVERKYRNRLNGHFERLLSVLPADRFRDTHGMGDGKAFSKTITRCEVLEMAMKVITESQTKRAA
ncbi:hypothetical protein OQA88_1068 [Cercophora sp. LCS_1]